MGRSKSNFHTSQIGIQYNPNLTITEVRTDIGMIRFDKMTKRDFQNVTKSICRSTIDNENLEKGYKLLEVQRSAPNFELYNKNYENPFGLPRFMIVK